MPIHNSSLSGFTSFELPSTLPSKYKPQLHDLSEEKLNRGHAGHSGKSRQPSAGRRATAKESFLSNLHPRTHSKKLRYPAQFRREESSEESDDSDRFTIDSRDSGSDSSHALSFKKVGSVPQTRDQDTVKRAVARLIQTIEEKGRENGALREELDELRIQAIEANQRELRLQKEVAELRARLGELEQAQQTSSAAPLAPETPAEPEREDNETRPAEEEEPALHSDAEQPQGKAHAAGSPPARSDIQEIVEQTIAALSQKLPAAEYAPISSKSYTEANDSLSSVSSLEDAADSACEPCLNQREADLKQQSAELLAVDNSHIITGSKLMLQDEALAFNQDRSQLTELVNEMNNLDPKAELPRWTSIDGDICEQVGKVMSRRNRVYIINNLVVTKEKSHAHDEIRGVSAFQA